MSGKTTYFTTRDFTEKGVLAPSGFEYTINNSYFRKGDSLSDRQIKDVLDICKKYHALNIDTLIVKEEETLTIWIEERFQTMAGETDDIFQDRPQQSQTETIANNSLPTKTVTKRYRGQVYEETVIDWSAVQQLDRQNKPARKYRGRYVD